MSAFEALHPALRYHIANTLGWSSLRRTQLEAIGPVLAGDDLLLLAPTAGGKTEACVFPLLSRMLTEHWRGLAILYVCPLRALLNNLEPRIHRYASLVGRSAALWHGDIGDAARRQLQREPPDLLLTTPESLEAILISRRVDHRVLFAELRVVVVDELHAFAGDDRGWHLLAVLERLQRLAGRRLQRLGLSATVGNPDALLAWLARGDQKSRVVGPAQPPSEGDVTVDFVGSLNNTVTVLTQLFRGERRLIFCDSRARVEELAAGLRQKGVQTFVSHSSLSADERRQAEAAFATTPDCAIIATSTLELGLDVGDLDRVVQIDAPPSVASFLQRMGRTGRRSGSRRNCLILATTEEALIAALGVTQLWREGFIEAVHPPEKPMHLFAQQIMALVLQECGLATGEWRSWLGDVFSGIAEEERKCVLDHMLAEGILYADGGILGIGPAGERLFGRRHFLDLVSAFTTPLLLEVRCGRLRLGEVDPLSVQSQGGEAKVILLGGRSWRVLDIDWPRRVVSVESSSDSGQSHWFGSSRAMHASLCQAIERVLVQGPPEVALSSRASTRLKVLRDAFIFCDGDSLPIVRHGDSKLRLWTFAGGRANAMLAAGLAGAGLIIETSDNFSVRFAGCNPKALAGALGKIDADMLPTPVTARTLAKLKFGACLPEALACAVLAARLAENGVLHTTLARPRRLVSGET
ncbi:MAG: DEAD/DEAH box helicase [Rhodospirillales bacterium]|nr:DEAD/DEAH box helicase [Rhodospirillales bacterium]